MSGKGGKGKGGGVPRSKEVKTRAFSLPWERALCKRWFAKKRASCSVFGSEKVAAFFSLLARSQLAICLAAAPSRGQLPTLSAPNAWYGQTLQFYAKQKERKWTSRGPARRQKSMQ